MVLVVGVMGSCERCGRAGMSGVRWRWFAEVVILCGFESLGYLLARKVANVLLRLDTSTYEEMWRMLEEHGRFGGQWSRARSQRQFT